MQSFHHYCYFAFYSFFFCGTTLTLLQCFFTLFPSLSRPCLATTDVECSCSRRNDTNFEMKWLRCDYSSAIKINANERRRKKKHVSVELRMGREAGNRIIIHWKSLLVPWKLTADCIEKFGKISVALTSNIIHTHKLHT